MHPLISLTVVIFLSAVPWVFTNPPEQILNDEAIENTVFDIALEEAHSIEATKNLKQKEYRGILNTLTGGLFGSGSSSNSGSGNNRIESSTPRLSGRPGFGFIPDIQKGVSTILGGVATGNLEKILEGSFVFTPNRVQAVAGTVLDSVFSGSNNNNRNPSSGSSGSGSRPSQSSSSSFQNANNNNNSNRNNNINNSNPSDPSTVSPIEANKQLWEIIKLQQQQIHRQKQVIDEQIKTISTQPKVSSPSVYY